MFWPLTIGVLVMLATDWSTAQQLSNDAFSCDGRTTGYYADVTTGCQVYHMCDGLGRQFSYTCPNATLFQQRMLICDHWYMVNCSKSVQDYSANLLIGQKRPFVEDSETHPYARTPRPDLLSAPSNTSEYNTIYRIGHDHNLSPKNLVGAESEDEDSTEPTYFPPSHWSTEVPKPLVDATPIKRNRYQEGNQRNNVYRTNYTSGRAKSGDSVSRPKAKAIQLESPNRNNGNSFISSKGKASVLVDTSTRYKSNYKATTPVYPSSVEDTSSFSNIDLLPPPLPYAKSRVDKFRDYEPPSDLIPPSISENEKGESGSLGLLSNLPKKERPYSFPSNFEATTPVFPSQDELTKESVEKLAITEIRMHFFSNFKATTPVYPNFVDPTSPDPSQVGILPPQGYSVNFESKYKATTPQYPTSVDPTSPDPNQAGVLPPNRDTKDLNSFSSHFKATTPQYPTSVASTSPNPSEAGLLPPKRNNNVNFESNFKATTPQYPNYIDSSSPNPSDVGLLPPRETKFINFKSNFRATTPQYPTHVDATSPDPNQVGLIPPNQAASRIEADQYSETAKNSFSSLPSKFYQPPKFDQGTGVDESELQEQPGIRISNFMKSFNQSQWQDLRKVFHIPEYDFPLDDATRPSYDSVVNSFEPKTGKKR